MRQDRVKRFGVSNVGWGSGEVLPTFDERLEESEDTNLEGDGGGKRISWAKALRWLHTWCVGETAEKLHCCSRETRERSKCQRDGGIKPELVEGNLQGH